jgi:hypothetical protein
LISTKGFGHNLRSPSVVKDVVDFINESNHESVTAQQQLFSQQEKS